MLKRLEDSMVAVSRSMNIDARLKQDLLDPLLFRWTTIDGKYGARYRSILVLSDREFEVEHEHVWTRRSLKQVLLSDMDESLLRVALRTLAVGCVVTTVEHHWLSEVDRDPDRDQLFGWERYEEAGVTVVDMASLTVQTGPMAGRPYDSATGSIIPPSLNEVLSGAWPTEP